MNFVLCLLFGFGFSAMALQAAPQPLPSAGLQFSILEEIWQTGKKISLADYKGSWRIIADGRSKACGGNGKASYVPGGFQNKDGEKLLMILEDRTVSSWPPGTEKTYLTVSFPNEYGKGYSQGPYLVAEQEPQFAEWGWDITGNKLKLTQDIYEQFSCRLNSQNPEQIVCATKEVLNPCRTCDSNIRRCAAAPINVINLYEK